MKRMGVLGGIAVLVVGGLGRAPAPSATEQAWTSAISYYALGDTPGTLRVVFYPEGGGAPIPLPPIPLAPHQAGSLAVGGVGGLAAFTRGSAVLSADVPIAAVSVQFVPGPETDNYPILLYSGFMDGNHTFYIPTFLNGEFGATSLMGVQNIEPFPAVVEVRFYGVGAPAPVLTRTYEVPAGSSVVVPADAVGLPRPFNGSAVLRAYRRGEPDVPARVVAGVRETEDRGRGAYAFEGVPAGAYQVYMATMLCQAFGTNQTSYYAIQNVSLESPASVQVLFYDTYGRKIGQTEPRTIGPANKWSVNPCAYVPPGVSGSAVIRSAGAPVVAIGKVKDDRGMATAFVGQAGGGTRVAAPYIRWAATPSSGWRTYVAVMNVGDRPATDVKAKYYDGKGALKATHILATPSNPLPPLIKRNTDPSTAGALNPDGRFGEDPPGGALEVNSDQPVVVIVRAQRDLDPPLGPVSRFAEDYNGVIVP